MHDRVAPNFRSFTDKILQLEITEYYARYIDLVFKLDLIGAYQFWTYK
jgi:hypothetical protein